MSLWPWLWQSNVIVSTRYLRIGLINYRERSVTPWCLSNHNRYITATGDQPRCDLGRPSLSTLLLSLQKINIKLSPFCHLSFVSNELTQLWCLKGNLTLFFQAWNLFFHVSGFTLLIRTKFEIGVLSFNFSQHSWNGKCKCLSNFAPWLYIHAKCFFNWQAEFVECLTTLLTGTCREIEHFSWPFAWSGLLPRAEVLWKVTCCLFVCWIG